MDEVWPCLSLNKKKVCVCVYVFIYVYVLVWVCVCLPAFLPACLSVCLSVCHLSACRYVCLSVCLFVCLPGGVFFHESGWPAGVRVSVPLYGPCPPCARLTRTRVGLITPVKWTRHSVAPGLMPAGVRVLPHRGGTLPLPSSQGARASWQVRPILTILLCNTRVTPPTCF